METMPRLACYHYIPEDGLGSIYSVPKKERMNDPTFQRLLQSVLFDNMYDRYVSHRKTGKLNVKTLSKISYSDKLFKKKEERLNKNYSIALLVDCSGSMGEDDRYKFAFESAEKLSAHLASAKIPHAIYGFNVKTTLVKPFGLGRGKDIARKLRLLFQHMYCYWDHYSGDYYGSNVDINKMRLKDNDTMIDEIKKEFGASAASYVRRYEAAGWNCDAYAVRTVAKELKKQKGTKVMIVLSDGQPAYIHYEKYQFPDFLKVRSDGDHYDREGTDRDLKNEVKRTIKSGIEVHSIGIQTDAVNRYYPSDRCCSIYNLSQLYDHIIKIIKLNLKRG